MMPEPKELFDCYQPGTVLQPYFHTPIVQAISSIFRDESQVLVFVDVFSFGLSSLNPLPTFIQEQRQRHRLRQRAEDYAGTQRSLAENLGTLLQMNIQMAIRS